MPPRLVDKNILSGRYIFVSLGATVATVIDCCCYFYVISRETTRQLSCHDNGLFLETPDMPLP